MTEQPKARSGLPDNRRQKRSVIVSCRLSASEIEAVRRVAELRGQSLSQFMRSAALDRFHPKEQPMLQYRYHSHHRVGLVIQGDEDAPKWVAWVDNGQCCEAGHTGVRDAVDHAAFSLRDALLAEVANYPEGSYGRQVLAGITGGSEAESA